MKPSFFSLNKEKSSFDSCYFKKKQQQQTTADIYTADGEKESEQ